jgi:hypothetical protein
LLTDKYAIIGGVNISYRNMTDYNDLGDFLHSGGELTVFDAGVFKYYNSDIGIGKYKSLSEYGIFELYFGGGYGKAFTTDRNYINNMVIFFFSLI